MTVKPITPFSVEGTRVRLEPLTEADAEAMARGFADPEILKWVPRPDPYTIDDAREWIAKAGPESWEAGTAKWGVHLAETGEFVGEIDLRPIDPRAYNVGFWMSPEHRGLGLMTDALGAAVKAAFNELDAIRVEWAAYAGNWASWKPAWRNGFRREGTRRAQTDGNGTHDMWTAAIVRGDLMHPVTPWDGPGAIGSAVGPSLDPSRPQALVAQFHQTYSMPDRLASGETPTLEYDRLHMRLSLIAEEFCELFGAALGMGSREILEDAVERAFAADEGERDLIETADALADMVYVIYGMALESGINLDAVLAEVQASNLSKLMPDGSVLLRADGKVLKGPNFFPPDVAAALGVRADDEGASDGDAQAN